MKILIANWGKGCGGGQYTLFVLTGKNTKANHFDLIDHVSDPFGAKYKVFGEKDFDDHDGFETQEAIAEMYVESSVKEQDFSDFNLGQHYISLATSRA